MGSVSTSLKQKAANLKNPSNKGKFPKYQLGNNLYTGNNYYITLPIIDKISLFSNPALNDEEKRQLNKILYFDAKNKEEGKDPDNPVEIMTFKTKEQKNDTRYKNHYRITPPGSNGSVAFFFSPVAANQRFIKMEFSPWKLGPKGMAYFIDWYNTHIVHSTYQDVIKEKGCIGKLHIAFDIIGVHIADLILNYEDGTKSNEWHGVTGRIETLYPDAKPGKPSKLKIYNKVKQAKEKDEYLPYKGDFPVTRVEKEIETSLSLIGLHKLKRTHFKGVRLPLPLDLDTVMPEQEHHWKLFLDSVRYRGRKSAIGRLPKKLQQHYAKRLETCVVDAFPYQEIHDTLWKKYWPKALEKSKVLET